VILRRPKFKISEDEVQRTILAVIRTADVVNVKTKIKEVKEDPKDDMIIETAIDGCADVIVTGDSHLLALETFRASTL
jgi:putative PIN family toxin of toxin-antitoxin system